MSTENLSNISLLLRGGKEEETAEHYDRLSVEMLGNERASNVLLFATARPDEATFNASVARISDNFSRGGQNVRLFHEYNKPPTQEEIKEKLAWAELIHFGGGDTQRAIWFLENFKIAMPLKKAIIGGTALTGVSAGAILPMLWGHSDSLSFHVPDGIDVSEVDKQWDYINTFGLDIVDAALAPHYSSIQSPHSKVRSDYFHEMFAAFWAESGELYNPIIGIGLDEKAALLINNGLVTALRSPTEIDPGTHRIHMENGAVVAARLGVNESVSIEKFLST